MECRDKKLFQIALPPFSRVQDSLDTTNIVPQDRLVIKMPIVGILWEGHTRQALHKARNFKMKCRMT